MLLPALVVQNRWERVAKYPPDPTMIIEFSKLFCLYDVAFRRVIVPHEGLGARNLDHDPEWRAL